MINKICTNFPLINTTHNILCDTKLNMTSLQRTFESETPDQRKKRLHNRSQTHYRKRQKIKYAADTNSINRQDSNNIKHYELGRMDQICVYCDAKFWIEERNHGSNQTSPAFAVCCAGGKVSLPALLEPPSYLLDLYTSPGPISNSFRKNIRAYNNILACTSFGADVDERFQMRGISNFRIHGQVYHCIGSLLPEDDNPPMFAQLYIYDTEHENENRHSIIQGLNNDILQHLQDMLSECNPYIKNFR